ncbi:PREDICTED: photosystem II 5 kDa protein, chloroplastic-like [Tarenaya hassleriana]|uniref:photosystem II 5 kDa protein, chloroplastic-like n=1 Tax=Tarenaya hassleriana TaxID=28532 RepID=UPI00053C7C16|nr:PREDICTED: photosystem II 5 kDa protein, chloroplastic-like [Tarenaya hassleriana]
MASMTMTTASCLPSVAVKPPSAISGRRRFTVVRASTAGENTTAGFTTAKQEQSKTMRRDIVFGAAAAAAATMAKAAMAENGEPKRGTEEAKKKYSPICVTMPTARICHK